MNPRAGLASKRALGALGRGRPSWGAIEVRLTERRGQARELARRAADQGYDLVLAVGGDGTANEAAWGLFGSETVLGVVPGGSGNGLARVFRMPRNPRRALRLLEEGVTRRMDVGFVNGRPFLNVAGAGFDAEIGGAFDALTERGGRRGLLSYLRIGLRRVLSYEAQGWILRAGDSRFEGRALLVAFLNGRQYGAGAVVAPRARLDDGELDLIVLEDAPPVELILNAPRLFLGGMEGFRGYRHFAAKEALLTAARPFAHHRDGEPEAGAEALKVCMVHRALKVAVPQRTALDPDGPFLPTPNPARSRVPLRGGEGV